MRLIEYRGHLDAVDVPAFQLGGVKARTPIEVGDDVADDLTAEGSQWFALTDAEAAEHRKALAKAAADAAKTAGKTDTETEV